MNHKLDKENNNMTTLSNIYIVYISYLQVKLLSIRRIQILHLQISKDNCKPETKKVWHVAEWAPELGQVMDWFLNWTRSQFTLCT